MLREKQNDIIINDAWTSLKKFTAARIALGRTGISIPSKESLQFKMDHAHARDAVFSLLNIDNLLNDLKQFNLPVYHLQTQAANKHIYVKRPDLGRKLSDESTKKLSVISNINYDVCITLTDGLSATAINHHSIKILSLLIPMLIKTGKTIAPICLIEQGRVAVADETASLLNAKLSLILIGERPGLSSPDSLGAYITYNPKPGLTDESRNCISNIRQQGLDYKIAIDKIFHLIQESMQLRLSGVELKENHLVIKENI